jgi:hypothetical protein
MISFTIHNVIIGTIGIMHPEKVSSMKPINFSLAGPEFGVFALACQNN